MFFWVEFTALSPANNPAWQLPSSALTKGPRCIPCVCMRPCTDSHQAFPHANKMKSPIALDISIPRYTPPIMHIQHAFIKHIRRARLTSVISAPVGFTMHTALYIATKPNNALHALLKHTTEACWTARV